MNITLVNADRLLRAALMRAQALGISVSVVILDAGGHMKAFSRMDRAWLGSIDVALKKAKTSVLFETETENVWEFSRADAQAHGIESTNDVLVTFAGGIPLKGPTGCLVGAVGVSGGLVSQDQEVAKAAAQEFHEHLSSPAGDSPSGEPTC